MLFSRYIELIVRGGVSCLPAALLFLVVLDGILFMLTGNDDIQQVMMTYIRAWMSLKFGQIRPGTTELAALKRLKN